MKRQARTGESLRRGSRWFPWDFHRLAQGDPWRGSRSRCIRISGYLTPRASGSAESMTSHMAECISTRVYTERVHASLGVECTCTAKHKRADAVSTPCGRGGRAHLRVPRPTPFASSRLCLMCPRNVDAKHQGDLISLGGRLLAIGRKELGIGNTKGCLGETKTT